MATNNKSLKNNTSTEPLSTRLHEPLHARMVQNFLLVWLDPNIDEINNDDCRDSMEKLRQVVNTVKTFTDVGKCIEYIDGIKQEKIFMISPGALCETTVPIIHDKPQVNIIYIFCEDDTRHQEWTKQWSKIGGVFTNITSICEALKQATQDCDQNSISISLVKKTDGVANRSLDELDQSFMYTQILKEILLTIDFEQTHIDEFLADCRQQFSGKTKELKDIDRLEREYRHHKPIWWYTYNCFLFSMLNRALRTMEISLIVKMGFFIRHLHNHLVALHKQQYAGQTHSNSFIVYRGQGLPQENFDDMVKTKGGLLAFNNFLSTSKNVDVSLSFVQRTMSTPNSVGVLFVITIDPSISSTPFADIQNVSAYNKEAEILFSMHSVFRIAEIKQIDGNDRLWQVDLTLTGDNDPLLHALTERMREETDGSTGWPRLGALMIKLAQYTEAEELYKLLLAQTTDEREKGNILNQLGYIKYDQGKHADALRFYENSLQINENTLPANHPVLATSYDNIGEVYRGMGKYSKALSYYEKALEIWQKTLPVNPDLATSYNNIGGVYHNRGKYSKALSYYEKALGIRQKTLSANHPDLAASYNNIGGVYHNMGEYSKALSYSEKALEIFEKVLPANHPDLVTSYNNIGMVYGCMGEYSKALSYYEKALEIRQKTLPANHPDLATSYNNIGGVYHNMGEYSKALSYYEKALSYYEKALEIRQKTLPANHPDLATSYNNIGMVYGCMGEYSKALSYYEKALEIRQKTLPANHPDLATSYNNIGGVYDNMSEYSKALSYYEKALEIFEKVLPANHPDLATSYNSIGEVYHNRGKYSKALSYYEKALEIRQKTLSANHPDLATSYNSIGEVYHNRGKYSKALSYYEKALGIRQKTLSANHPDLAASYNNIGGVYHNMGEYSKALSYSEKALEIFEKVLPANHPDLVTSYNNVGALYRNMGDYKKALSYFQRALDIQKRSLPPNHPHLKKTIETMIMLKINLKINCK